MVFIVLALLGLWSQQVRAQWIQCNLNQPAVTSFALIDSVFFVLANGFPFKSTDLGNTWNSAGFIPSDANGERLLVWKGNLLLTTGFYWILKSTDTGKSWSEWNDDNLKAEGAGEIFALGDTLFANTAGSGLIESSNAGQSWFFTERFYNDTAVKQFSLDGQYLFVGCTKGGLFRSSDRGVSWVHLTPWLGDTVVNTIATNGPIVYAGTWGAGIYRSTDYGVHWQAVNNGFSLRDARSLLVLDDKVFVGFNDGGGVYESIDSGKTWTSKNVGMAGQDVLALATFDNSLFAGTLGDNGLFRRLLSDFDAVRQEPSSPVGLSLNQSYPNPVSSKTTITFDLQEYSHVSLVIIDALGREIPIIISKEMGIGSHDIIWDATAFPSGVYSCRITANGVSKSSKIDVLR